MKTLLTKTLLLFLVFLSSQIQGQTDVKITERIDSLFLEWNVPNHPGGAIGVMQHGKIIYSKAFGLASLEYLVPNSHSTIFNTGSVSKQFTAMGIVRLEEQGKISFDEDIHTYIPELPPFPEKITVRHLLHHTSGLRSLHALFALAGWRGDDSRTNEDLNRIIQNQQELNFSPGSEYLYCNTGYMLMVNIIENTTGEKFPEWMQQNIFEPLHMPHTYVEDNYSRVVPDNATSYYGRNTFDRAVEYWGYVGSGNMHSTTADLLNWLRNFSTPEPGWESSFTTMQTVDALTDGTENNYAFGVIVDTHLGHKRIQHGGAIGGFRAFIATYPEKELNIVVLTNFSAGNPGSKAHQITRLLLGAPHLSQQEENTIALVTLSTKELQQFEGSYWNAKEKYARKIYLKNDTLRYYRAENDETLLIPVSKHEFKMYDTDDDITVRFESGQGKKRMLVTIPEQSLVVFDAFKDVPVSQKELAQYAGTYYSPEVETSYTIAVQNDSLTIYHPRHGYIPVKRQFKDVLTGDWPVNTIEVQRNSRNKVIGLRITNGRVRNAWFRKE